MDHEGRGVDRASRIRNEKLREHQYIIEYARSLDGKRIKCDVGNNVEHLWEQVKRTLVQNSKEVCDSLRGGGMNPMSLWWNDEIKTAVMRNEAAWKEIEIKMQKTDVWKLTEKKRERLKLAYIRAKRINEQF